jgi:hypothetical protein
MVQSVEASAKNRLICGFHQSWCTNRRRQNLLNYYQCKKPKFLY